MSYISRRLCGWFDGVDDKVQVTNTFDFNNPITIFVVFRAVNKSNENSICGNYNDNLTVGYNGWFLRINNGDLNLVVWDSGTPYYYSYAGYSLGNSYAVGLVSYGKGNGADVYVDGVKVGTHSYGLVNDTSAFMIGQRSQVSPSAMYFNGDIYAVYIYNRALSDVEIAKLNEDPFDLNNVPKDGLVGWWDFNKADWNNGILPDLSGNGNDGTISGVVQRDVLVKRGTGSLPNYELTHSWWIDGIDDYVYIESKGFGLDFMDRNISEMFWVKNYSFGDSVIVNTNDWTGNVGEIVLDGDLNANVIHCVSGDEGYIMSKDITGDLSWNRSVGVYINNIKVSDNTQNVNVFRVEIVNKRSGDIVYSKDFLDTQFSVTSFDAFVDAGYIFLPSSEYSIKVYSYGNVEFWIEQVGVNAEYCNLAFSNPVGHLRHKTNNFWFLVFHDDGTYSDIDVSVADGVGEWILTGGIYDYDNQKIIVVGNDSIYYSITARYQKLLRNGDSLSIGSTSLGFVGEFASVMFYDRVLSQAEVSSIYNKQFVLDGLVHWFVVDESGNLVDLVTGKSYVIQGNPYIRRIYDSTGKLNSGVGVVVFDIIKDERNI